MKEFETRPATLEKFIDMAEAEGLVLHCHYQDLWFTPDELREENANGRFQWGPVNWELRPAQDRSTQLERQMEQANAALTRWLERTRSLRP